MEKAPKSGKVQRVPISEVVLVSILRNNKAINLLIFLFPLTFYFITCSPGIGFGDTAIIIDNIYNFKIDSQVNTHPLSVFVAQPFMWLPIDNIAFKANLMSVFAGATSVFLLYYALFLVFEQRLVPILVAGLFMFSKSMWWHSTVVENYAVSSVITGLALIAYVKLWKTQDTKWLQALFFLVGLGLYNHVQFGFLGMGVGVAFLMQLRKEAEPLKLFIKCFLAITIGLAPWLITLMIDYSRNGDFLLTLQMAFVGVFGQTFFSVSFFQGLKDTGFVYFLEYPHLFLPVPFIGIYFAGKKLGWQSSTFWGVLTYLVANTICFTYYNTWDRFAFLLQSILILTFFGAFAVNALFEHLEKRDRYFSKWLVITALVACMFFSAAFYPLMTQMGKQPGTIWYDNWNNNYSINLYEHSEFTINPNKMGYREIDVFAERLFAVLPKGAIYIDDDSRTYYPIVMYFQGLLDRRRDINAMLINSWSIDGWGSSPRDIASVIERAKLKNQPLYMASLKWPYNTILSYLSPTVQFEKVVIAEDRWIYRLITDGPQQDGFDVSGLSGASVIDFDFRHIEPDDDVEYALQNMEAFNGQWRFNDQVFVNLNDGSRSARLSINSRIEAEVDLAIQFTVANDFGQFDLYFNNRLLEEGVDLYSPSVATKLLNFPNKVKLHEGLNYLELRVSNQKLNSNLKLGLDYMRISE